MIRAAMAVSGVLPIGVLAGGVRFSGVRGRREGWDWLAAAAGRRSGFPGGDCTTSAAGLRLLPATFECDGSLGVGIGASVNVE